MVPVLPPSLSLSLSFHTKRQESTTTSLPPSLTVSSVFICGILGLHHTPRTSLVAEKVSKPLHQSVRMDEISRRRPFAGFGVSRNRTGIALRGTADSRDQNAQFCNRIGCSGRLKSTKSVQTEYLEKTKTPRPAFRSANSTGVVGSNYSKTSCTVKNANGTLISPRNKGPFKMNTDSPKTSTVREKGDASELIKSSRQIRTGLQTAMDDAEFGDATSMEVGTSSVASDTRLQKNNHQKSRLGIHDPLTVSSAPLASKSTGHGVRHSASSSRNDLRNLRCVSTSEVNSSNCSSLEFSLNMRKDTVKKRSCERENNSSTWGKNTSTPSSFEEKRNISSGGPSVSDLRRSKLRIPRNRDSNVGPVRTRRPNNDNSNRARLSNQSSLSILGPQSSVVLPHNRAASRVNATNTTPLLSAEGSSTRSNCESLPCSSSDNLHNTMEMDPADFAFSHRPLNRNGMQHHNIDAIAEVLLALERIEQDEEIATEQLLALESNLSLNGLVFRDQHRDMRLDIDNMSYEELLALEEQMGTVSTALSDKELLTCLRKSTYQPASLKTQPMGHGADCDDDRCIICQEEYSDGDEVARMQCEHRYHLDCIEQWLQLKNWCPICKASAVT